MQNINFWSSFKLSKSYCKYFKIWLDSKSKQIRTKAEQENWAGIQFTTKQVLF